ncbi:hypothetical protein Tco_0332911 [Tanacetum coccineum]
MPSLHHPATITYISSNRVPSPSPSDATNITITSTPPPTPQQPPSPPHQSSSLLPHIPITANATIIITPPSLPYHDPPQGCVRFKNHHKGALGSEFGFYNSTKGAFDFDRDTCEGYIFITARVFLEGTPVMGTYGFHYCPGVLGGDTYDGIDDPNINMEEYIRLEEEKARKRGKMFNWETAMYGKIWYDKDIHDLKSVETEFPAIAFNDEISTETLSYEPTVRSLNDEIDFRISFDDSDDEDYTVIFEKNLFSYKIISTNDLKTDSENDNEKVMPSLPSPEPAVSCFDDLDFFKDFKNEFPAIVYNNAQTSKSDLLTEPTVSPQHIDEFNLKDETSLSECDEEEHNVLYFNDLFSFNIIYPNDPKSDKDNDDDKVDIEHSFRDMSVIPLPNVINVDDGAYAHGYPYGVSWGMDTVYRLPVQYLGPRWNENDEVDYYSEDQYAVSIKEDTTYPCLHSPKTTKERRSIRRIQKKSIRRIEDIVCEYSGRYQTWSLLQETPIRRIQHIGYAVNLDNLTNNVLIPLDSWTSGLLEYRLPLSSTSINVKKEQSLDLSADMIVMTSKTELESLVGPLFDEYLNRENQVVLKSSVVTTVDAFDKRQQQPDSTSSTSTPGPTITADENFTL